MNKKMFYLIIAIIGVSILLSAKLYFQTKEKFLKENRYLTTLKEKILKIKSLQEKYKFNYNALNIIKKYCSIYNKEDKFIIKCNDLDSNNFTEVQNSLFRKNFKLNNFTIMKNKNVSLNAEITK